MSIVFVAEKTLPMEVVRIDGGTQSRCAIDGNMVENYAEQMAEGAAFPPVVAFFDGKEYWLADGFHRYHAWRKNKRPTLQARIVNGTLREAILYSFGANGMHGMQMTIEDKRRIVLEMLNDFEWGSYKDREIARACHVSHTFVARMRASMEEVKSSSKKSDTSERAPKKTSAAGPVTLVEPPVAEVTDKPDEKQEALEFLIEENDKLKDQLAAATAEDPEFAKSHMEELRQELKLAKIELAAVIKSRDQFQAENSQLKKQVSYLQKQLKKAA